SLNGRDGPIAPIAIQATNFGLQRTRFNKSKILANFMERYKLSIDRFPNHNMLPVTQIDTFYNGLTLRHRDTINAATGGTFIKRHLEECYDLIENMIAHHNDWDTQPNEPQLAKHKTYMLREPTKANDVILKNMQTNMTSLTNSNLELKNMFGQFMKMNTASSSGSGTLPGNTITYPKEDLKGITTRSGTAYQGPMILTTSSFSSLPQDTSAQCSESSSSITSSDTKIAALKAKMAEINKNLMRVLQVSQQVKAVTPNCETCGDPHSFSNCPATVGNTQNVYAAGAYQ
nr:reverse transcriptase domain-containing protein [Tanacetum cinerariifolium]